jgi:hypothetical protein
MSVKVMGRVWDADLSPNHKLVLLAYADAAEHDGTQSYPGWERLVKMTGYSRSQIERITRELLEIGVLTKTRQGFRGQRAEFAVLVSQIATQSDEIVSRGGRESVAQLRDTSRPDPSTSPKGDGLFEAFFQFWTGNPYSPGAQITKSMRGRLNAAVKEARHAGIDAEDVQARGRKYVEKWREIERTPQALLANWHRFAPEAPISICGDCDNRGVVWVDAAGRRVSADDPDSSSAVRCRSCMEAVNA